MTDTNQPTESNEVEFHEKVQTPIGRTRAARAGIVAGAAFLFVVGAVAAMGASPSPSTGADPAASAAPGSTTAPNASAAPGTTKPEGGRTASAVSATSARRLRPVRLPRHHDHRDQRLRPLARDR